MEQATLTPTAERPTVAPTLAEVRRVNRDRLRQHYDRFAAERARWRKKARYYHRDIERYYQFMTLPNSSVLEIGCGTGDLLAALKPKRGLGVDLSEKMIEQARKNHPNLEFICADFQELDLDETFDYVILDGTLHDIDDIQLLLSKLRNVCGPNTRIIANTFLSHWQAALQLAQNLGLKMPEPLQNWLPTNDLKNLFHISGFDVIRVTQRMLFPRYIPLVSWFLNRIVANLWPFRRLCLTRFLVARCPMPPASGVVTCSVVITCRDERDNIEPLIQRTAVLGNVAEIIFAEGHSKDGTREEIQRCIAKYPSRSIRMVVQDGIGQGDAMRKGFKHANGDLILWLEADLTTPPEEIIKLYTVLAEGKAEFVNGSRLVYPMPKGSMRFLNMLGNRFFGRMFTWLLGQTFRDTLCGLKGLTRAGYQRILAEKDYFGDFDPFGDFEILFGSAKRNLKILEVPVHYRPRYYGTTKISRFRDGWLLLKMSWTALWRLKLY